MDQHSGSAGDLVAASACGFCGPTTLQPGGDRRRVAAVAATDLLRHGARSKTRRSGSCRSRCWPAYFFVLVALLFVGPGQEMGRRFAAIDNRVAGLHGRYPRQPGRHRGVRPDVVLPRTGLDLVLDRARDRHRLHPAQAMLHALGALAVLALVGLADWPRDALGVPTEVIWSPYYQVRFKPRYLSIDVNNLGHQGMLPVDRAGPGLLFALPTQS